MPSSDDEELQRRREVLQVEQRQVVVVAVLEDQREDRGLGLVEVEDLAEEQRPEASGRSPGPARRAGRTATGTRPDGRPARTSRPSDCGALDRPSGWSRRRASPCPVTSPLTSATNTGHAGLRQLAREELERLGLAGARSPRRSARGGSSSTARPGPARRCTSSPSSIGLPMTSAGSVEGVAGRHRVAEAWSIGSQSPGLGSGYRGLGRPRVTSALPRTMAPAGDRAVPTSARSSSSPTPWPWRSA